MLKIFLVIIAAVLVMTAYACCMVAGDADRREEELRKNKGVTENDIDN